jgi:hypothetical protein
VFQTVDDITKETGKCVDMKGQPMTADALCEMVESVDIEFDKHGKPQLPSFIAGPDVERQIRELLALPEVQLRIDVILREKWLTRYALPTR